MTQSAHTQVVEKVTEAAVCQDEEVWGALVRQSFSNAEIMGVLAYFLHETFFFF